MSLNDEDIKQLIAILQKGLASDKEISSDETLDDKPVVKRGRIKTTHSDKKDTKKKEKSLNRFDQMMEKSLHKEDLAVDKLLSKHPPTARTREFSPVNVTCRVCGKHENINGAILTDAPSRYKCNSCSKEPG
jgi:hypothetical protein